MFFFVHGNKKERKKCRQEGTLFRGVPFLQSPSQTKKRGTPPSFKHPRLKGKCILFDSLSVISNSKLLGLQFKINLLMRLQQGTRTIWNVVTPPEELCESGKVVGQGSPRLHSAGCWGQSPRQRGGAGDGVPDKEVGDVQFHPTKYKSFPQKGTCLFLWIL